MIFLGFRAISSPDFALLPYRYSMSLFIVIAEIFILIPIFVFLKKVITPAIYCSQSFHEWRYLWLIPATFYLIWYYMVYGKRAKSGKNCPSRHFAVMTVRLAIFEIISSTNKSWPGDFLMAAK